MRHEKDIIDEVNGGRIMKHASDTIHMFAENLYICLGYRKRKELLSVRRTKRSMRHEKDIIIIDEVNGGRITNFSSYSGAIMHRRAP
eukprot:scaffold70262_cov88-Cyclotella_meneghiniana.AAC.1